jgi:hypothetical protein
MRNFILLAATLILTACGGGSDGTGITYNVSAPAPTAPTPAAPVAAAYYTFSDASTGQSGQLLLAPSGNFYAETSVPGCITIYIGSLTIASDGTIQGTASYGPDILANSTCSAGGTATFGGNLIVGQEINITGGGQDFSFQYDPTVSEAGASDAQIDGNWLTSDGTVVSISKGAFSAQDATTGCVINGTYSIPNPNANVYLVSANYSNCTGENTVFNGQTVTGIFAVNYDSNKIFGGLSATINGQTYVLLSDLEKD